MTCGSMGLATLHFETKLQECVRFGITIKFNLYLGNDIVRYTVGYHVLWLLSSVAISLNLYCTYPQTNSLNRGSYMSAHVLLNLLNELGRRDKMRGLPSILSPFRNEFNKFNNTRARMLDSIYHMSLRFL